jgi:hypothetical protein
MKDAKRFVNVARHSAALLLGVSITGFMPSAAHAQTLTELRAAHKAAYDPKALLLLKQMADAYSRLTELEQTTDFYVLQTPLIQGKGKSDQDSIQNPKSNQNPKSKIQNGEDEAGTLPRTPVDKPVGRSVHLMLSAPNRLRLETKESGSESEPAKTFVSACDGKILWTFNPDKNWYTQEKAPRRLRDFQKVTLSNTTLETMMTIGMNPFTDVENQFDAAKYEGTQDIRGVPVEVVLLRAVSEQQTQDLRFYIGRDDLLLRRMVIESTPIVREMEPPKRDPLDDLIAHPSRPVPEPANPAIPVASGFEDPHPIAPPGAPMKMRLTLENTLNADPRFDVTSFHYEPPSGAMLYNDVNGSRGFSKLTNTLAIEEILRKARMAKHNKKSKSKSQNPTATLQP